MSREPSPLHTFVKRTVPIAHILSREPSPLHIEPRQVIARDESNIGVHGEIVEPAASLLKRGMKKHAAGTQPDHQAAIEDGI